MDTSTILSAFLQLTAAVLLGSVMLSISYKIVRRFIGNKHQIADDNAAFAVLASGVLLSVGNIMEGMISPISDLLRQLRNIHDSFGGLLTDSLLYVGAFLLIGAVVALFVNIVSVRLYVSLTKVDELAEIAKNNLAVAILTATVIVIISGFAKEPAVLLMESLIPYPEMPSVN